MTDFADREAVSIIDLCRSLRNSPADLHGLIAAKLRFIRQEGKLEGITTSLATMRGERRQDEPPAWSADGFTPPKEATR